MIMEDKLIIRGESLNPTPVGSVLLLPYTAPLTIRRNNAN